MPQVYVVENRRDMQQSMVFTFPWNFVICQITSTSYVSLLKLIKSLIFPVTGSAVCLNEHCQIYGSTSIWFSMIILMQIQEVKSNIAKSCACYNQTLSVHWRNQKALVCINYFLFQIAADLIEISLHCKQRLHWRQADRWCTHT